MFQTLLLLLSFSCVALLYFLFAQQHRVNGQLSIVNALVPLVNCQLSIVNTSRFSRFPTGTPSAHVSLFTPDSYRDHHSPLTPDSYRDHHSPLT
jgi:hypothetical protein